MRKIVFLGDSVTDARHSDGLNSPYGTGFVSVVRNTLWFRYPNLSDIAVLNRGVGGETLLQIAERLEKDVLDEKPDLLFIEAGVNDSWRKFDSAEGGTPDSVFAECYEKLLQRIRDESPKTRIILLTPYALALTPMSRRIRDDLPGKIGIVRSLASRYGCPLIDLSVIMDSYGRYLEGKAIALDGIHPAVMGCAIIAEEAMKAIESFFRLS